MENFSPSKSMTKSIASGPRLLGVLLFVLLFSHSAVARLSETEAEVQARYGYPVFILPSPVEASLTKCYLAGGYSIAVTYMKGRSVRETFAKADKSKLTEKDILSLLQGNTGGAVWIQQDLAGQKNVPNGLLGWRTIDDQPRVALYDERTQAFFVTTQRFINQTNTANRRKAAKASRGAVASRDEERLLRSFLNGNSLLGAGRDLPTSSPARNGAPSK